MKYKLCDSVTIMENEKEYIFYTELKKIIVIKKHKFKKMLDLLLSGETEIIDINGMEKEFEVLKQNKILIVNHKYSNDENYCTKKYFENFVERASEVFTKVEKKKIMIIGLGGIGQCILQHLASSGFKQFVLVDFDTANVKNRNRQFLCTKSKIGNLKTEIVREYFEQNIDGILINVFNQKIETAQTLNNIIRETNPDMIVCAADTPPVFINKLIAESARKFKIPCSFASVGLHLGEVGPILVQEKCKQTYIEMLEIKRNQKVIYAPILEGSISFTNTLISVMLAQDILFYFTGIHTPNSLEQSVLYRLNDMQLIRKIPY